MKFTLSWLNEHLETSATVTEIAEALTMIGLEVESVQTPDPALKDFIVAHVLMVQQHPQADRLTVCQLETGSGTCQVVCGAPNVRVGMKGLLARPGVVIPLSGERLGKSVIRGVESQGMLCSARELNLGEDQTEVVELPADTLVGAGALEVLTLDPVFDIGVAPNRADCLGVQGIARDLAAAGLGLLKTTPPLLPVPGVFTSPLSVTRIAERECPLFVGRFLRGIHNGPSPIWLQQRLIAVGLRPVSALVDITNLLSLDSARPLHVFDADKLTGSLTIRLAQSGERLTALNGRTYALQADMIVTADNTGPQALAGLIGGATTACSEATMNVFLEAALFDSVRIARTGRTLGIESEARHRFERGVDPAAVIAGAERGTRLILDLCGGEPSTLVISGAEPVWQRTLYLRLERFRRLIGYDLMPSVIRRWLEAIGCAVEVEQDGILTVIPPSWRHDLEAEHDLIEEIVRLHGYDQVPILPLPLPQVPTFLPLAQQQRSLVRRTLATRGLLETVTWSFTSSAHVALCEGEMANDLTIVNPINADLNALRVSLLPNLILAVGRNAAHDMLDSALFEIGPQFYDATPGAQKLVVAGVRAGHDGPRHWNKLPRPVDVFDVKADALAILTAVDVPVVTLQISPDASCWYHPGRSGTLRLGEVMVGCFGEIHPRMARAFNVKSSLAGFEVFLDSLPPLEISSGNKPLLEIPLFHPVVRDFTFVVDSATPAEEVLKAARSTDRTLIIATQVVNVYEGIDKGCKSLTITVTLQPTIKPLTDQDIEAVSSRLIKAVIHTTGATLRI